MTPIEKAARAVCADECDVARHGPDRCDCKWWTAHVPAVHAMLGALHEPSIKMVDKGASAVSSASAMHLAARFAWQAMLDAALKEGP